MKPIKKEAKNIRKQQLAAHQHAQSGNASTVNQLQQPQVNGSTNAKAFNMFASDQQVSLKSIFFVLHLFVKALLLLNNGLNNCQAATEHERLTQVGLTSLA